MPHALTQALVTVAISRAMPSVLRSTRRGWRKFAPDSTLTVMVQHWLVLATTRLTQGSSAPLVLLVAALVTGGCASDGSTPVPESVTVDPLQPTRVRFVVHGDPGLKKYPEIQALSLPMHEKIREGMRRHATDLLAERGLCPKGFIGPDLVWGYERSRLTRQFFVDCVQ